MHGSDATARLTEREKQALRAWLDHKTAKEIALDLGISHHAVEKRLKMARTKLGAGSTLAAARMLAGAEGALPAQQVRQTVTESPDLAPVPARDPSARYRPIVLGGIAMSLAIVLVLALAAPGEPAAEKAAPAAAPEIALNPNIEPIFDRLDANGSGFLESPESPFIDIAFVDERMGDAPDEPGGTAVPGESSKPEHVAAFYASADQDRDGRVSFREYHSWSQARRDELGIEIASVVRVRPAPES
jgi:DNA-binding CsgD family transcriptional regulator